MKRYDTELLTRVAEALPRDTDEFDLNSGFLSCREGVCTLGNQSVVTGMSRFAVSSQIAPDFVQGGKLTSIREEIQRMQSYFDA
jgi:hypothetical protein